MVKVFASPNSVIVRLARDVLAQNEIGTIIKNDRLAAAAGEIPWTEVWVELWLSDERQIERAKELLKAFEGEADPREAGVPWTCAACGESSEDQFTDCWNCGQPRGTE